MEGKLGTELGANKFANALKKLFLKVVFYIL